MGSVRRRTSNRAVAGVVAMAVAAVAGAVVITTVGHSPDSPGAAVQPSRSPTLAGSPNEAGRPSSLAPSAFARFMDGRLVAGGQRVPGHWAYLLASRGHTWLASKRRVEYWGTGRRAHALPDTRCCRAELSFDGHWIAYVATTSAGRLLRLVDAATGLVRAELPAPAEYARGMAIEGVTNDGVVLLLGCPARQRVCHGNWLGPYVTFPVARRAWLPDDGRLVDLPGYNGKGRALEAGFILTRVGARSSSLIDRRKVLGGDLVRIDLAGRPQVVAPIPLQDFVTRGGWSTMSIWLTVSPSATWLLQNGTGAPRARGPIGVRPLHGGPMSVLEPPTGWTFDNVGWDVTWESDDVFVSGLMRTTRPRGPGHARCSISLGQCVLIQE